MTTASKEPNRNAPFPRQTFGSDSTLSNGSFMAAITHMPGGVHELELAIPASKFTPEGRVVETHRYVVEFHPNKSDDSTPADQKKYYSHVRVARLDDCKNVMSELSFNIATKTVEGMLQDTQKQNDLKIFLISVFNHMPTAQGNYRSEMRTDMFNAGINIGRAGELKILILRKW